MFTLMLPAPLIVYFACMLLPLYASRCRRYYAAAAIRCFSAYAFAMILC